LLQTKIKPQFDRTVTERSKVLFCFQPASNSCQFFCPSRLPILLFDKQSTGALPKAILPDHRPDYVVKDPGTQIRLGGPKSKELYRILFAFVKNIIYRVVTVWTNQESSSRIPVSERAFLPARE